MLQQGRCINCSIEFMYNDQDRSGKFCSKKCHYASKNELATCIYCSKEFERRIKEARKTCSKECWINSRGIKSKDPAIKEESKARQALKNGQMVIEEVTRRSFFNQSLYKFKFTLIAITLWMPLLMFQKGPIEFKIWAIISVLTLIILVVDAIVLTLMPDSYPTCNMHGKLWCGFRECVLKRSWKR